MKFGFSNIVASAVLTAGVVSMSATGALAKPGGGQTATACSVDNIYGDIAPVACADAENWGDQDTKDEGSDLSPWLADYFGETVSFTNLGGSGKSDNKVEGYNGTDAYYSVSSAGGTLGTITFNQDIESAFSIVLKAATTWSAYLFEGATAGDTINWEMDGVAQNSNGNAAQLSHASLFITNKVVEVENPPQEVPEPTTLLGLIAVGGMLVGKKGLSRKS
jgi:hypothetical protein